MNHSWIVFSQSFSPEGEERQRIYHLYGGPTKTFQQKGIKLVVLLFDENVLLCPSSKPEIPEGEKLFSFFMTVRTDVNEIGKQKAKRKMV